MLWPSKTLKSKEQIKTKISEASHRKQTSTLLILVLLDYVQNIQAAWCGRLVPSASRYWQMHQQISSNSKPHESFSTEVPSEPMTILPACHRNMSLAQTKNTVIIISLHTLHIYMFKTNHLFASLFRRLFAVMGVAPVNRTNFLVRSGLGQVVPCQGSWKPTATWPTNPKMPPLHKAISGATYRWIWDTEIQHHVLIFWESWRISLREHLDALGYFRLLALDYEARTNCAGRPPIWKNSLGMKLGNTVSNWTGPLTFLHWTIEKQSLQWGPNHQTSDASFI